MTNVLLRWYKLFRQTTPAKTPSDIDILRALSNRFVGVKQIMRNINIKRIIRIIRIICIIYIMTIERMISQWVWSSDHGH